MTGVEVTIAAAVDPRTGFFFNDPPPPEIYALSLHDALPICPRNVGIIAGRVADRGAIQVERGDRKIVGVLPSDNRVADAQPVRTPATGVARGAAIVE